MYLETDRMILRKFTMDDLNDLYEIFGDPIVMKHVEPAYSIGKTKLFLEKFCINRQPPGAFAAMLKEGGKVVGYVLFNEQDSASIFEIGWIFNKDFWGRGLAFEICTRLIQHGFEDMNLHKICAQATDATKSVNLMQKLGMAQEGIQRKHTKSNDGKWLDLHLYAILADDHKEC